MRKLIVAEHFSLDGIIQGPGGPKEDPSDNFRLGGWTVPFTDETIGQAMQEHSTSTSKGVLITRYVHGGEVRTGTFGEVE